MRNELCLRLKWLHRAVQCSDVCRKQREQILTPNRGKAELSGWGPRSAVCLPDAFSHRGKSAYGATAHDDVHDDAHCAFMTLSRHTRTREDEVHALGLGVRNGSRRARSRPLSEPSESIERACEATSAEGTARCASRGNTRSKKALRYVSCHEGQGLVEMPWLAFYGENQY